MAKNLFKFISAYFMATIVLAIVYQPVIPFLGYTLDIPPFYIAVIIAVIALFIIIYTLLNKHDGKAIKIGIALSFITVIVLTYFQFLLNTFFNGYICKYDIIDPLCGYLTNKWGRKVIPYKDYEFYALKDKKTYIFQDFYWDKDDNHKIKLDVYQDQSGEFVLLSSVIMKYSNDESAQTIAEYIEKEYCKVEWHYQANNYAYVDDYWGLDGPIVIVKKVDGGKSEPTEKSDDGYTDLGPIDCYISDLHDDHIANDIKNIHLYAKSYEGKSLYFIKSKYDKDNYRPLTKGSWTRSNIRFNARCSLGSNIFYYVNVSLWDSSGSSSNGSSSGTIRMERDPVPVQEWVQCGACNGSGKCFNCNGTGRNLYSDSYRECVGCGGFGKCSSCAGHGGHYKVQYK